MANVIGELVAAAVVDKRVWDAYGANASDGVYLVGQPGPALPFVFFRAWKVPTGFVSEEIRLIGPSGRTILRWGPEPRRMVGAMDLTTEVDEVDDAVFDETGTFVASFMLNGEIVGEIEVPVFVQSAPVKLSKDAEDGLKKSDVIWVGTESPNGRRRTVPAWFAYKNGKIYVLSQREPGPDEQTIPGVPDANQLVIITRRKLRDTELQEFYAAQRKLEGPEWEEAAKLLVDKRKSRAGAPAESLRSAMTQQGHLKVLVICGYYDVATPFNGIEHTIAHMKLDPSIRKNVSFTYYEGGHMMYIQKKEREKLRKDIVTFIGGASRGEMASGK